MRRLLRNRKLWVGVAGVVLFVALALGQSALEKSAVAQTEGLTWGPIFEVDPLWPKPLPNNWVIGAAIGVSVDEWDHVWIVHREATLNAGEIEAAADPPVAVDCCVPAPPVLEFDPAGNVKRHWGGPGEGFEWPRSNHGVTVDYKGNVWIGGNDREDAHILKFTRNGDFLLQVGRAGARAGAATTWRTSAGWRRSRSTRSSQRGVRLGRLRQPAGGGDRRRHRRVQAVLGGVRQRAGRRGPRTLRPARRRRRSSSARRCTAPRCRTTGCCTSATG